MGALVAAEVLVLAQGAAIMHPADTKRLVRVHRSTMFVPRGGMVTRRLWRLVDGEELEGGETTT